MSNTELFINRINEYVKQNGTDDIMTSSEILSLVEMEDKKGSIIPTDYCYNRYNNGLGDFKKHVHLFEYTEDKRFRILGDNYKYTGIVLHKPKNGEEIKVGEWEDGEVFLAPEVLIADVSEEIIKRRNNLYEGLEIELSHIPVSIEKEDNTIKVNFQELLLCGVSVEEEAYKIYNAPIGWKEKTTYLCNKAEDETVFYYIETIDECIGEVRRLVLYVAQNGYSETTPIGRHTSELSKVVPADAFEKAYKDFIRQADENAETGRGRGKKIPYGYSEKPFCDGAYFKPQYGQGAASSTPYMNWWVVSVYYLPKSGNIVLGIEKGRYPYLNEMTIKPVKTDKLGSLDMHYFYSTNVHAVDYSELYERFICLCEEVMRLGLVDKNTI